MYTILYKYFIHIYLTSNALYILNLVPFLRNPSIWNVIYDRFLLFLYLMTTFQFSVFLSFYFIIFFCIFFVNEFLNTNGREKWLIKSAKFMRNWYSCSFIHVCFAKQILKNCGLWFMRFFNYKIIRAYLHFIAFLFLVLLISFFNQREKEREREWERDLNFIAIGRKILMKFDAIAARVADQWPQHKNEGKAAAATDEWRRRRWEGGSSSNSICHACNIIGHTGGWGGGRSQTFVLQSVADFVCTYPLPLPTSPAHPLQQTCLHQCSDNCFCFQ